MSAKRPKEYYNRYYAANPERYKRINAGCRARSAAEPRNIAMGAVLRRERKRNRMTQTELAELVGCNKATIHYWESAKIPVNVERIGAVLPELAEEIRRAGNAVQEQNEAVQNVPVFSENGGRSFLRSHRDDRTEPGEGGVDQRSAIQILRCLRAAGCGGAEESGGRAAEALYGGGKL